MASPAMTPNPGAARSRRMWAKILYTCALSMGSHYGSYLLGPLKHRMHEHLDTSNTQFSLMIAAYNISSTWTPLVAGIAVSRIGVYYGAILSTAIIAVGQIVLLIGSCLNSMSLMTAGLFLFGLAFSPLSVCQETLIYTLFPKSRNLNLIIGCGLLAGKITAFAASITAVPLSDNFGDQAPFVASALLAGFSCVASLALFRLSRIEDNEGSDQDSHLRHKVVRLGDMAELSNIFWIYVLINIVGGYVWQPFLHLSSSMIEHIYGLSDRGAAFDSSVLLAGAIIVYPALGWTVDRMKARSPTAPFVCMILAACLTAACYAWLLLPATVTGAPVFGLILFAAGYGASSFLLVVLVPYVVRQPAFISTGLGMHKAMEMSSTTLSQTLSGLFLDWDAKDLTPHPRARRAVDAVRSRPARPALRAVSADRDTAAARGLLSVFLGINVCLIGLALALRWAYVKQLPDLAEEDYAYQPIAMSSTPGIVPNTPVMSRHSFAPLTPLLPNDSEDLSKGAEEDEETQAGTESMSRSWTLDDAPSPSTGGKSVRLRLALTYIGIVWVVFWVTMLINVLKRE